MSGNESPIDLERIQDATGGDAEFLKELVNIFIEDTQLRIRELRAALVSNNPADLGRTAHKLKGSSANLGAIGVSSMAHALEELGKAQALDRAGAVIEGLEAEMVKVESTLTQMVAGT